MTDFDKFIKDTLCVNDRHGFSQKDSWEIQSWYSYTQSNDTINNLFDIFVQEKSSFARYIVNDESRN